MKQIGEPLELVEVVLPETATPPEGESAPPEVPLRVVSRAESDEPEVPATAIRRAGRLLARALHLRRERDAGPRWRTDPVVSQVGSRTEDGVPGLAHDVERGLRGRR
jgi:hypothetical protein